eukprot:PhM_4_TR17516/c0_g1_i1/m.51087
MATALFSLTRSRFLFIFSVLMLMWLGFLLRKLSIVATPSDEMGEAARGRMMMIKRATAATTPPTEGPTATPPEQQLRIEREEEKEGGRKLPQTDPPEDNKVDEVTDDLLAIPMLDLDDTTTRDKCPHNAHFKDSDMNMKFMAKFTKIFKKLKLQWWLDEGGLIGSARAGSMNNADDDFDFFAVLPNQRHPCRPDSHTCQSEEEYNRFIHSFLMNFWNEGMCINKFHPNVDQFKSRGRLMYSLQLDRSYHGTAEQGCFDPKASFAHMHLGIMTPDQTSLHTNVWAGHTTHPQDKLPLDVILPVARCRSGRLDAPCPRNLTGYLSMRNRGEYRKRSGDGSCLLVRNKWNEKRRQLAVDTIKMLDECGYNTMIDLLPAFLKSGMKGC